SDAASTVQIFAVFQLLVAAGAWYVMKSQLPFNVCAFWFGAISATSATLLWGCRLITRDPTNHKRLENLSKTAPLLSALVAVLWGATAFSAHHVNVLELRFLTFAMVLMMCVMGASSLVRLPISAILFAFTIITAISLNMTSVVNNHTVVAVILAWIFAFGLISIILMTHENFFRHMTTEIENDKQRDVIKLLLNEFERETSDWLWETNANGHLVYFSPQLADVLGTDGQTLQGQHFATSFHAVSPKGQTNSLPDLMTNNTSIIAKNFTTITHDQTRHWQITAHPLTDRGGEFLGYRGVGRDITDTVLHDREVQLARDEAERANSTKSQFLAVMSHELRTPINAIVGFSEVLNSTQGESLPAISRREYLTTIQESAVHLQGLINDVLDATRVERGTLQLNHQEIDAAELIETTVKILRNQATRSKVCLVASVIDNVLISGDLTRLKQVILNLISNAIKFSPEGGVVNIEMLATQNRGLVIAIRDAGIGIKPEDIERVFEPFAQAEQGADRKFGGMGLGLAIARKIARLHGGDITLNTNNGIGTEALISLPPSRMRWPRRQTKASGSVAA
ncbi:MAG: HAMP domain-containing histidine kinase, partial [Alphaproteobacteria bacterium]|nr:HAMP domain-containing histidine kinase [Alphaproteobacteria bacterium]